MEILPIPGFYEQQEAGGYTFQDDEAFVSVTFDLPPGASADALCVSAGVASLHVELASTTLLDIPQLYSTILASGVACSVLADGRATIRLPKADSGIRWPALVRGAPSGVSDGALAARERVRALLEAAAAGDVTALSAAADACDAAEGLGTAVAARDGAGRTALHFAASRGHVPAAAALLARGACVDRRDDGGDTALAHAIRAGHGPVADMLLESGASADATAGGRAGGPASPPTALHAAAGADLESVVMSLLAAGAPVDCPSVAGTPLLYAAGCGASRSVSRLLHAGADPKATDSGGTPALVLALAGGHASCVASLLSSGADPCVRLPGGATALHVAADGGLAATAALLLGSGADANAADDDGYRPIDAAAMAGHRTVVDVLWPVTTAPPDVMDWTPEGVMRRGAQDAASLAARDTAAVGCDHHSPTVPPPPVDGAGSDVGLTPDVEDPPLVGDAAAHKAAGDGAFRSGHWGASVEAYTRAVTTCGGRVPAVLLANRSAARLAAGDATGALEDAEAAVARRPRWGKARYRVGTALSALGRHADAAQALFEGVRLDPGSIDLARSFKAAVDAGRAQHAAEASGGVGGPAVTAA